MSIKSVTMTPAAARTAALWDEIERTVHHSCTLRCEHREDEAATLLQQTLPALIRDWSAISGLSTENCRNALRQLFDQAQERVATAILCKRLVLGSLGGPDTNESLPANASTSRPARLVSAPPAGDRLHVRRRVPIGDIAGMLDALDETDREGRFRRQNFPSVAQSPLPALAMV